ncbi:hypothetical protein [Amycolatopsis minnesotensis]
MVKANFEQRVAALEERVWLLTGKVAEVREDLSGFRGEVQAGFAAQA